MRFYALGDNKIVLNLQFGCDSSSIGNFLVVQGHVNMVLDVFLYKQPSSTLNDIKQCSRNKALYRVFCDHTSASWKVFFLHAFFIFKD